MRLMRQALPSARCGAHMWARISLSRVGSESFEVKASPKASTPQQSPPQAVLPNRLVWSRPAARGGRRSLSLAFPLDAFKET